MHFTKMHGLGNDYLYVYGEAPENVAELSVKLSERHFGAGSDGMIYISKSDIADFKMRIFNADGSEAKMCGNGIRCVGKYVYDKGYTDKTKITVETLSGTRTLDLTVENGSVSWASVDMGKAEVGERKSLTALDTALEYIPVSVGNPHAVIFTDDAESVPLASFGPVIEHHKDFPDGVNAEFVQVIDPRKLRMRVWERGSGITMACGTGACASVSAAVKNGYCPFDEFISIQLDGGALRIKVDRNFNVTMVGPAKTVYEGEAYDIT
ncbi:MAG: diaminopimelate epimerase [Clostridia bacterium]|nr:diaminopimelate epimerase [Clostridia bacterium]